jgi:hypothetical protein
MNRVKGYSPEERIGNISKEILAPLVDNPFGSVACVGDNINYTSGYYFLCLLAYVNFNHSPQGYALDVIVHASNSQIWIDEMYSKLCAYEINAYDFDISTHP